MAIQIAAEVGLEVVNSAMVFYHHFLIKLAKRIICPVPMIFWVNVSAITDKKIFCRKFGGAEGIVSIEDILEEVVEDIQDEYDDREPEIQWIQRQEDGSLLVNARIDLSDLAEELGTPLPKGRYASLAGFILEKAGDVPEVGSIIDYKSLRFTIIRGTDRSIDEVNISTDWLFRLDHTSARKVECILLNILDIFGYK